MTTEYDTLARGVAVPPDRTFGVQIGSKLIADLRTPKAEEIDLEGLEAALKTLRRFSSTPGALVVWDHEIVVEELMKAIDPSMPEEVLWWGRHHDDHEGVIGDLPGPFGRLINEYTDIVSVTKGNLDRVICAAHGRPYPSFTTRSRVSPYDRLSETLEWRFLLGHPQRPWNVNLDAFHPAWNENGLRSLFLAIVDGLR